MSRPSEMDAFEEYDGVRGFARQAFVTGAAVTLPLIVTLVVLGAVIDFISQQLNPVVGLFTSVTGLRSVSQMALKLITVLALLAAIFCIGVWTERRPNRSGFGAFFDTLVSRIPGVGSLYQSIDEMSGLLLDSDTDSFQEVKLVEFPDQGSYTFAFLTADTPDVVRDATDEDGEMITVFLPMAPNPVMGGYVLHVAEKHVFDVDMTVEEGIQSIVTSGVATGQRSDEEFTEGMLDRFERRLDAADVMVGIEELEETARETVAAARSKAQTDEQDDDVEDGRRNRNHDTD
ncbi:DUF502 domain-containing protein [Haloplanus aerogenes]|uniref:DUF502 domain-containing protein n=1 Tax=Haloplanus aerogenes TaxID=660522 RepID=A0A3M0DT38_9EURY|nr:DUF502 domain-containing protein [Haloplanus aerogenes]AZH25463.1 DUF502 domain-containing protein [Haloplanus aerogenes]RMB25175.1 putative membrane protein [Haloplanus aerogenes]